MKLYNFTFFLYQNNEGSYTSCIMKACAKENARQASSALKKEIGGITET